MRRRKRGERDECGWAEEEVLSGSARSVSLKLNRVGGGQGGRDGRERESSEEAKEGRGGGGGGANRGKEKIRG